MPQYLPRGFEVKESTKIRNIVASGEEYQIYETNNSSMAVAVSCSLCEKWVELGFVPNGLFSVAAAGSMCAFFCGSEDYIISSLLNGPFPNSSIQIEAFSVSFKQAVKEGKIKNFDDALYIEEYSMILPLIFDNGEIADEIVYTRWLTGGVEIALNNTNRLVSIMSWIPPEKLQSIIKTAGFEFEYSQHDDIFSADSGSTVESGKNVLISSPEPEPRGSFTLPGRPELEKFFNDNIIDVVTHAEQYKRMGISFPGATVLYGPPGCGKTYAVEKLSEYLGWKRFNIDSSSIASSYIHATSKLISEVFSSAINAAPSILVIDEMEAFLSNRADAGPSGTHHTEEVAEFLRRIPEAVSKGVLIFAMTNMLDKIDPAIIRKGRFDNIIEVKMATAKEICELLKVRFRTLPIDESVDAEKIAMQLDGHPLSDVSYILKEAGRAAIKENSDNITADCFNTALATLPKPKESRRIGF
jgi:cell division protease FtsH